MIGANAGLPILLTTAQITAVNTNIPFGTFSAADIARVLGDKVATYQDSVTGQRYQVNTAGTGLTVIGVTNAVASSAPILPLGGLGSFGNGIVPNFSVLPVAMASIRWAQREPILMTRRWKMRWIRTSNASSGSNQPRLSRPLITLSQPGQP